MRHLLALLCLTTLPIGNPIAVPNVDSMETSEPQHVDTLYVSGPAVDSLSDSIPVPDTIHIHDTPLARRISPEDSTTLLHQPPLIHPLPDTIDAARDTVPAATKTPAPRYPPDDSLYCGISYRQDFYARKYIREVYNFSWDEAEHYAKKMRRLERRKKLPPLSYLLMISSRVFRLFNGEYRNERKRRQLHHEISDLSKKAGRLIDVKAVPDSLKPVYLLINGGIKGLVATLKVESNIVEAAVEGFSALRQLEEVTEQAPDIYDACLGLGIFYCSVARAPLIVRAALNLSGRKISFEQGLDYLRKSAYNGRYTTELSQLYLIQFLSPYFGHLVREKNALFDTLKTRYPENPMYVFLSLDEKICFHPETITDALIDSLPNQSTQWKKSTFSHKRYAQLVNYQYRFLVPEDTLHKPDTTFDLREFSFYPLFLGVLSARRNRGDAITQNNGSIWKHLTTDESFAIRTLGISSMSTSRRNFYEWHIRDALRIK